MPPTLALYLLTLFVAVHPPMHASPRVSLGRAPTPRAATGRIEGTVEISSALSSRRPQFRIYADPGPGAVPPPPPSEGLAAEMRNVVLYLEAPRGKPIPAPDSLVHAHLHGTVAQSDERFSPHVLPVMQGATVDFPNEDDVFHNVFSLSSARTFDLGRYPRGESKSVTFSRAGTVQVFCHIHGDMSAIVLVLPNPYFATPESSGRFVIDNVPEGEYSIVGWHERIRPIVKTIRVTAGHTSTIDFNIPLPPAQPATDR